MLEKDGKSWLLNILKGIPDVVRKNAILALARGVANLLATATDVPVAYLEGVADSKRVKTEAERKVLMAAANAAAELVHEDNEIAKRALNYFGAKIVKEQVNRESVAQLMLEDLRSDPPREDTQEAIDDDWLTFFWELAGHKSREDVQLFLARLLKNEICKPGSVSPHTLQLLSILTSSLANSFQRLCNLSIDDGESVFVIHPRTFHFQNIGPLNDYGIDYKDLFDLDDAGLLRSAETLTVNYAGNKEDGHEIVDYAGHPAKLNVSGKQLRLLQFTQAGRELRNIIVMEPNEKYTVTLKTKLEDALEFPVE